jgi:S1-C subfamily serine protease
MVVLAGSGHLVYNLGINQRARENSGLPFGTVICVPVPADRDSVEVVRSLADFVWGIPAEERPVFPSLGLALKMFDGLDNPVVDREPFDGVAQGAGFEKGDVVLNVEGEVFHDINRLRTRLAGFTWGDKVRFQVLRVGEVKAIDVTFEVHDGD